MKKTLSIFLILLASFILWKCASQTTPTGGPKDETPPTLKKSVPANNQTNFKGKVVELTFDELLKLKDAKEEIIITPSPGKEVQFTAKQNKVLVDPKEGWKENTTYSISFREGVQDLNEGNPALDLYLAFSTGATIDSLQISGKITQSFTEKIPEKITIGLYQQDTFDIFKHSPLYFTKTNKKGAFKIENLKSGSFFVYAFDDKNKNLKVESQTEKFGFVESFIKSEPKPAKKIKDTLSIAMYQIDSRPLKINSIRNTGTITQIKFNKALLTYSISNLSKAKINHSFDTDQSVVNIYNQLPTNDSIQLSLRGTDSLSLKIDSTFYIKRIESKQPKDKFTSKIITASFDLETYTVTANVVFSKPLNQINLDSIYLTPDAVAERKTKDLPTDKKKIEKEKEKEKQLKTETKKDTIKKEVPKPIRLPISSKNIKLDSSKNILKISTVIDKKIITDKVKEINLVLDEAFIISIENDSSKREIKSIPIIDAKTAGILHIEVITQYKNYEIQLLSPSGAIVQKIRNVKKHSFKYLQAQEYKLMFYADLNNNGIWDAQNIYEKKAQEPTYFYKSEGKYTFPIRSTWEVGPFILRF